MDVVWMLGLLVAVGTLLAAVDVTGAGRLVVWLLPDAADGSEVSRVVDWEAEGWLRGAA